MKIFNIVTDGKSINLKLSWWDGKIGKNRTGGKKIWKMERLAKIGQVGKK